MDSSCKSSTYVCFECHRHRRRRVYQNHDEPTVSCPDCQAPMTSIGSKLEVPRKDDANAWKEFRKQWITPGYGDKGEVEIDAENEHFRVCKIKRQDPPKGFESLGCERCDRVWERTPETEKDLWRRRGWNLCR